MPATPRVCRRLVDLPALLALLLCAACAGATSARTGADGGPPVDAGGPGACGAAVEPSADVIVTDHGAIRGIVQDGVRAWLGVPFAAPPVGPLRFAPPAPPPCREGVSRADTLPPKCPQLEAPAGGGAAVPVGAEDCLQLNVWAPGVAADRRPVLFFIHGGGNTIGSSVQRVADGRLLYDGARLARETGAVVVTTQYRLGPLGFLAHPALGAESDEGASGNQGILDQIAALAWVSRHAARFGGDPARVLVFGESAGAVDTCVLLASPRAAGLFSAALMQSGACNQRPLAVAEGEGAIFAREAGCADAPDVAACLRALTVEEALTAVPVEVSVIGGLPGPVQWAPNVDGRVLEESPLDAMAAGRSHPVPLVVGSNTEETSQSAPLIPDTDDAYRAALRALGLGELGAGLVMEAYPREAFGSARAALVQATTDARFTCSARAAVRAQTQGHPDVPVYRYLFGHRAEGGSPVLAALGAWHGLELAYLFGVLDVGGYVPTAEDEAMSTLLADTWASFAEDGDPNGPAVPVPWPRATEGDEALLFLRDGTAAAVPDPRADRCDFWDALVGR